MPKAIPDKQDILDAIREVAQKHGHSPSRSEFKAASGMSEYQVLKYFPSWREAVRAAGLESAPTNIKLADSDLLKDWGALVRSHRHIPTRNQYRREGKYSPGVFDRHFGSWSRVPAQFRTFAQDKPEWADVLVLLPVTNSIRPSSSGSPSPRSISRESQRLHSKIGDRPTYGNPIDFRGLRHEPVNEQGVVFLFGMVAKELGYMVEAVQAGFPDCEAKRQVSSGKWQRVRIEFEFESRTFRDHGHDPSGCDVIVCWRHNWPECPTHLEVLELASVIRVLAKSDD